MEGHTNLRNSKVEVKEEDLDSHVQVKAMTMKVCSIKPKEPSLEREEEPQEVREHELEIQVRPFKMGKQGAKEEERP